MKKQCSSPLIKEALKGDIFCVFSLKCYVDIKEFVMNYIADMP